MPTLKERIVGLLAVTNGLKDRELADQLLGLGKHPSSVQQACTGLAKAGVLERRGTPRGLENHLLEPGMTALVQKAAPVTMPLLKQTEDEVNEALRAWLLTQGWTIESFCPGNQRGIDVVARRGEERWLIEVKGSGKTPQVEQNYMYGNLGQLLFKMTDAQAKYSVAFPDMPKFTRMWGRLPQVARERTKITALFVSVVGEVREES